MSAYCARGDFLYTVFHTVRNEKMSKNGRKLSHCLTILVRCVTIVSTGNGSTKELLENKLCSKK